jgi:hypothetical protein
MGAWMTVGEYFSSLMFGLVAPAALAYMACTPCKNAPPHLLLILLSWPAFGLLGLAQRGHQNLWSFENCSHFFCSS